MTQTTIENEQNSKLLKGMIIGGIIGGVFTLLDSQTRTKLMDSAVGLKDTSKDMLKEVKQNPTMVKEQMMQQFKDASSTLKEAISDAQAVYELVNEQVLSRMDEIKELSSEAMSTAKIATNDIKNIGSKVVEAGSSLTENPIKSAGSSTDVSSGMETEYGTGLGMETGTEPFPQEPDDSAIIVTPDTQKNSSNL